MFSDVYNALRGQLKERGWVIASRIDNILNLFIKYLSQCLLNGVGDHVGNVV